MRRPQISSSQKSVKTPRRRRTTPTIRAAAAASSSHLPAEDASEAVRAELPRGHAEALPELLAEVVLGVKAAAPRDLRHAQIAALEQARGLLQPLLLEEVAEEPAGDAVEASGDVLTRVAE